MTEQLQKDPERRISSTTQQKSREISQKTKKKKSPRRREVCSTDRILAEVKVSSSAPGGPPRHSSLPLSSSNRQALSPLPRTLALALAVRVSERRLGLALQRCGLWQPSNHQIWAAGARTRSVYLTVCPFSLYTKAEQIRLRAHRQHHHHHHPPHPTIIPPLTWLPMMARRNSRVQCENSDEEGRAGLTFNCRMLPTESLSQFNLT